MRRFINNLVLLILSFIWLFNLFCCVNNDYIVFANFESYMSLNLMQKITNDHNVNFVFYSSNEEINSKFSKNYDVAIPSIYQAISLIEEGMISEINWDYFGLNDEHGQKIKEGKDVKSLLNNSTNLILDQLTRKYANLFGPEGLYPGKCLLDFVIPYFLQDFIFAYKGEEIPELTTAKNWNNFTDLISPVLNLHLDQRFMPTLRSHIGCIDDARTVYGLSKLIGSQNMYPFDKKSWAINPIDKNLNIEEYKLDYHNFVSKFKKNYFYFNSDSYQILSSFSSRNGNNSTFAYNGDILYAAEGAELYDPYNEENFHFFRATDNFNLTTLDCLVFNKKNSSNVNRLKRIYSVAKSIALDGADLENKANNKHIYDKENGEYVYGIMSNFDFLQYSSPFKIVDKYVLDEQNNYFSNYSPSQQKLFQKIYRIDFGSEFEDYICNVVECPISVLDKSNMHWAYIYEKELL